MPYVRMAHEYKDIACDDTTPLHLSAHPRTQWPAVEVLHLVASGDGVVGLGYRPYQQIRDWTEGGRATGAEQLHRPNLLHL